MFRLLRLVVFVAIAIGVSMWISESRGDVGIDRVMVTDPVSGKPAPTTVWYPSDAPAKSMELGPYSFRAAPGAVPNGTARGLIVVSHGSGGSSLAHIDTATALVEAGFVVAAPRHPGDNFGNAFDRGTWQVFAGRPRTMSAVVDTVRADPRFAEILTEKPTGALGLSMGGYTVLALVGGVPNLKALAAFCEDNAHDAYCALGAARPSAGEQEKSLTGLADPRIRAAVAIAPATALFADDAFASIAVPLRFYVAGQDGIVHPDQHAERFRAHFVPGIEYVRVEVAGHVSFTTPLPKAITWAMPAFLRDPKGFDRETFLKNWNRDIVAYFEKNLR